MKSDAMKDIDEIRRDNIAILELEAGSPTAAAETVQMSLAQWSNLRDGAKDSKTGKKRGMRKETARRIEIAFGRQPMWLDEDHSAPNFYVAAEPKTPYQNFQARKKTKRELRIEEINAFLSSTDIEGLAVVLREAERMAEQYPLAKQTPASSR